MITFISSIILGAVLVLQLLSYSVYATTTGPIDINYGEIPATIEKGKNLLLNVNLTNKDKNIVENFNLALVSSGLKAITQNGFPGKIYPNSTIHKQYVLEAIDMGKYNIYSDWAYDIRFNSNSNSNTSLTTQLSGISNIGQVEVVQPSFEIEFSSIWQTIIPTIIGLTAGALITRLGEEFKEKADERKERKKNINKIKSIIAYQLGKYEKNLDMDPHWWQSKPQLGTVLIDQGLNQYLDEIPGLEKEIGDLDTKIKIAEKQQTDMMKKDLRSKISAIRELTKNWK